MLFCSACCEVSKESNFEKLYIFNGTITKCKMYSDEFCKIPLLVNKGVDLLNLKMTSFQDRMTFRIIKLEICNQNRVLLSESDCMNELFQFGYNVTNSDLSKSYEPAYAIVNALLVGRGRLALGNDNQSLYEHNILVITPERLIDSLFKLFMLLAQLVTSFMMGLLIDRSHIYQIFKMPIPVLIGIICQVSLQK